MKIRPAFCNGDKNPTSFPGLFYSRRDPGNDVDKYLAARQLRGLFVPAKRVFTSLKRIWPVLSEYLNFRFSVVFPCCCCVHPGVG